MRLNKSEEDYNHGKSYSGKVKNMNVMCHLMRNLLEGPKIQKHRFQ